MTKSVKLVTFLLLATASFFSLAKNDISTPSCQQNCVAIERLGSTLSIIWRGLDGQAQKAYAVQLSRDASLKGVNKIGSSIDSLGTYSGTGDGSVETVRHIYHTPTEVVIVYITIYYDASGNIVDVKSTEVRIPKGTQVK
jgi:hypothetical protein